MATKWICSGHSMWTLTWQSQQLSAHSYNKSHGASQACGVLLCNHKKMHTAVLLCHVCIPQGTQQWGLYGEHACICCMLAVFEHPSGRLMFQ